MFTGIIEEMGEIKRVEDHPGKRVLTIRTSTALLEHVVIGDSIAVNGVCLTVVQFTEESFTAELIPETLKRSNLARVTEGQHVNLEGAMRVGKSFGGHMVQGHVDCVLSLQEITDEGDAKNLRLELPESMRLYVVEKGFVTLDGTSLTVTRVQNNSFSVSLVPHTQSAVTLGQAEVGYHVNFEADMFAKYIEKHVSHMLSHISQAK